LRAVQRRADRLLAELRRLRDERDEYREAARSADGQRIALQRVLWLQAVRQ